MKLYSRKYHRYIERQIHFGVGKSVLTACGLTLHSRHVMVQLGSNSDGAIITDQMDKVTCKRCLTTKESKFRKLLAINQLCPGIFDRPALCGEDWLLKHALDISGECITRQTLNIRVGNKEITLSSKYSTQDRKIIIRSFVADIETHIIEKKEARG